MLIQALSDAHTTAGNSVMVGDIEFGREMAKAAGVRSIGVSWGYHEDRRLRLSGARDVADSMMPLDHWLFDAIARNACCSPTIQSGLACDGGLRRGSVGSSLVACNFEIALIDPLRASPAFTGL